jgi:hypothetical protein
MRAKSLSDLPMNVISTLGSFIGMAGICLDRLLKQRSALQKTRFLLRFSAASQHSAMPPYTFSLRVSPRSTELTASFRLGAHFKTSGSGRGILPMTPTNHGQDARALSAHIAPWFARRRLRGIAPLLESKIAGNVTTSLPLLRLDL